MFIHCTLSTPTMVKGTKEHVIKLLEGVVSALKANTSEIDTETALQIADILAHRPISIEEACTYLNISRSKFYKYIDEGLLPRGIKRTGWKELRWYKDELDKCKAKNNL